MGEWAASVLKGILEVLGELLAILVAIVVIILVIVIIVAVLSLIAAVIGWVALAVIAGLLVAGMLATFLARDGLGSPIRRSPAPGEKAEPRKKYPSDADSAEAADQYTAEDYGGLFEEVGRQDAKGGTERTVIRVVAITDDQGTVIGYRVQLPSTQNWSPFNENGALNDLSADAMLALFPGLETQYKKAVWDALEQAGALDSDAPIMLTGWSLGGMMAGDLAVDPRLEGRVQSVVTAGSAVDKHASDMDPSIRVTQVNNIWDPVHHLELVGYDPEDDVAGPNWQTYAPIDGRIHNADMYGELADDVIPSERRDRRGAAPRRTLGEQDRHPVVRRRPVGRGRGQRRSSRCRCRGLRRRPERSAPHLHRSGGLARGLLRSSHRDDHRQSLHHGQRRRPPRGWIGHRRSARPERR